jgi:adenine C2-methylase RlmN of 23S rRNA A2503 and tRNA A37
MTLRSVNVAALELGELENTLESRGIEAFHARQLYRWIYRRGITDFERMSSSLKTSLSRRRASPATNGPPTAPANSYSNSPTAAG